MARGIVLWGIARNLVIYQFILLSYSHPHFSKLARFFTLMNSCVSIVNSSLSFFKDTVVPF